jgi:hypothetical protein
LISSDVAGGTWQRILNDVIVKDARRPPGERAIAAAILWLR